MKKISTFFRRLLREEQGQTLVYFALGMVTMLGMGGFTVDLGHFYVVRSQLQSRTDAAGLAAAGSIFDSGSLSISGAEAAANANWTSNPTPGFSNATISLTTPCLNILLPTGATPCVNDSSGNASPIGTANSIRILTSVQMPTTFMRLFGVTQLTTAAETTASLEGPANLWNVAIVLDATGSMSDTDTTDSSCSGETKMQCSLQAVQGMLSTMQPCATGVSAANCNAQNSIYANAHVSLWSFPNMLTNQLNNAFTGCSGTSTPTGAPNTTYPTTTWYAPITLPQAGASGGYVPLTYKQVNVAGTPTWTASYEITYPAAGSAAAADADANGFVNDYYSAGNAVTGNLNSASSLVKAIGYTGTSKVFGCMPVAPDSITLNGALNLGASLLYDSSTGTQATSATTINTVGVGEGITDLAPVIYAAQQALAAEQLAHPGTQNAMIVLSDGGMNAQWIYFPQGDMAMPAGTPTVPVTTLSTYIYPSAAHTNTTTAATFQPGYGSGSNSYLFNGYSYYFSSSMLNTTPNYTSKVMGSLAPATPAAFIADFVTGGTALPSGLYPDWIDQCQQAIMAGNYVTSQGTLVFSVADQATASSCASGNHGDDFTDVTLVATGTYNSGSYAGNVANVTNCNTMENVASSLEYFYSDSGSACTSTDHPSTTTLKDILGAIGATFTSPRLLPNNAT